MGETLEAIENKDLENLPPATGLLQIYMKDVNRYPLLDKENEKKLTTQYAETRAKDLRIKLIQHNLRLVVKIAFEYRAAYHNLMDLIQEGNVGLIHGIDKFEPTREVPLANYAAKWIRAYMLRYIMNSARLVKVGTTEAQRKLFFNLAKEKAKLEALGIEPTDTELAGRLEVEEKELSEMKQRMAAPEGTIYAEDDDKHDLPLESAAIPPDEAYEQAEFKLTLSELLAQFRQGLVDKKADKKLIVFDLRFMKEEPEKLQIIADRADMDVTRARVQQIDAEIKEDLRFFLRKVVS